MHENVHSLLQRGEQLETLQNKTENLNSNAAQFKRGANKVRKQMWWKNMKMNLIIGAVVVTIVLVVVVALLAGNQTHTSNDNKKL